VLDGAGPRHSLDPEDSAHDHVERDRLHTRRERESAANRPALDLALGRLRDHPLVALDRLAVERRQEQLALPQVPRTVCGQHRVRAEHRSQG